MASTDGLVPITRAYLASYYDKYPFSPLSDDVSRISSQIRSSANDLLNHLPPTQGFILSLSLSSFYLLINNTIDRSFYVTEFWFPNIFFCVIQNFRSTPWITY